MPAIFDRVLPINLIANTAIFYVAARLYLLPLIPRIRPQQILSHSPFTFNATSGTDVPHTGRDFARVTVAVRVSGSVRRSANGGVGFRRDYSEEGRSYNLR